MTARQQAEWQAGRDMLAGMESYIVATCPACGVTGTVEGDYAIREHNATKTSTPARDRSASLAAPSAS